jgi:rhodanese-related sulfurtransferase
MRKRNIDPNLLEYCTTDRQREIIQAAIDSTSQRDAAQKLGVAHSLITATIARAEARAARAGYSPEHDMTRTVPDGYHVKGVSTLYDSDGNQKIQWVKSNIDQQRQAELMKSFAEGLCKEIKPCTAKPIPASMKHTPDLLTGVFIGDAHIGMRAFGKETKHSDFDTDIATGQLRDAIDYLVDKAEPTEIGLLVNVGDFLHANTQHNTTFSGTPLDVDTRHNMVMESAAEVMAYMVDRMLDKHAKVILVCARGNHDTDAAGMLALMMKFYYRLENRVTVLDSHGFYHYIEYGSWLLGIHHGDKQKMESLAGSMARDMAQAWGRTTHRLWCLGHYHKDAVKTFPGVKCKIFAALPPPDSWHASHGYAGDGEMEMLTFRREGGLYSSHVYNIPQPRHEPDVRL